MESDYLYILGGLITLRDQYRMIYIQLADEYEGKQGYCTDLLPQDVEKLIGSFGRLFKEKIRKSLSSA